MAPRASLLVIASAFGLGVLSIVAACSNGPKPAVIPSGGGDAGPTEGGAAKTSSLPTGLPPMAQMPPPGVLGSRKATKKANGALFTCGGGASPFAKDPADHIKKIGDGCAAASKMKPVGSPLRGQQNDNAQHAEHKVRVEANKCYRVYFATEENVHDAVVVMRDSAGDMVAESPGAALPDDGVVCFNTADEVTLMIAIGSGKGAYAAQLWSD
jgi:hypothetical protein